MNWMSLFGPALVAAGVSGAIAVVGFIVTPRTVRRLGFERTRAGARHHRGTDAADQRAQGCAGGGGGSAGRSGQQTGPDGHRAGTVTAAIFATAVAGTASLMRPKPAAGGRAGWKVRYAPAMMISATRLSSQLIPALPFRPPRQKRPGSRNILDRFNWDTASRATALRACEGAPVSVGLTRCYSDLPRFGLPSTRSK